MNINDSNAVIYVHNAVILHFTNMFTRIIAISILLAALFLTEHELFYLSLDDCPVECPMEGESEKEQQEETEEESKIRIDALDLSSLSDSTSTSYHWTTTEMPTETYTSLTTPPPRLINI